LKSERKRTREERKCEGKEKREIKRKISDNERRKKLRKCGMKG